VRFIPHFLSTNWTLKLAALGLAILLWTSVRVDTDNRQGLPGVPVRIDLTDPRWAVLGDPMPTNVEVRFTGPTRELFRMALDRPSLLVPIDEVTSPDTTILLRTQWVRIQDRPGVVVEDILPSSIRLAFEPIQTATVPLEPRVAGQLPEALALSAPISVAPSLARISGPASRMEQVDTVFTRPLDLSGVTGSGNYTAPIDTAGLSRIQIAPSSASIAVRVEPVLERRLEDVSVSLESPEEYPDLEFSPSAITITLRGPHSAVEALPEDSIRAVAGANAQLRNLRPGETRRVPVRLLGAPSFVQATPSVDSVAVRVRPSRR
jgi:YbbR domain-containing protein